VDIFPHNQEFGGQSPSTWSASSGKELREGEEWMRSIVDHVVDGIITINDHSTVESYNAAAHTE
jgi:hypothetical protein